MIEILVGLFFGSLVLLWLSQRDRRAHEAAALLLESLYLEVEEVDDPSLN